MVRVSSKFPWMDEKKPLLLITRAQHERAAARLVTQEALRIASEHRGVNSLRPSSTDVRPHVEKVLNGVEVITSPVEVRRLAESALMSWRLTRIPFIKKENIFPKYPIFPVEKNNPWLKKIRNKKPLKEEK